MTMASTHSLTSLSITVQSVSSNEQQAGEACVAVEKLHALTERLKTSKN